MITPFVELNKDFWHIITLYLAAEDTFKLVLTSKNFASPGPFLDIQSSVHKFIEDIVACFDKLNMNAVFHIGPHWQQAVVTPGLPFH